nr:MAG TPA: hypothetical protein [Caudoviricetes sp.]
MRFFTFVIIVPCQKSQPSLAMDSQKIAMVCSAF